jgi:phage-related minor tail protein
MADRIKGITIELDGDTTGLSTALRDVNSRTKDLQKELKDVEKLLKFDPNNVELLAQRQRLLTDQVEATTEKLNRLKEAEQQVQRQFERGEIGEEQYRAFRRELAHTEQALQGYQNAIHDMNSEQERVAQGTRQLSTLFEATGSSVEDYASAIGQRLVRAIQNGTATSRDLEYAFQRIGRQAIGADGDIDRLRATLGSVDSGNSLDAIRRDISQIASEAEEASGAVQELGGEIAGMVAGLAAGAGITAAIEKALDTSSLNTQIDITFDVPEESKKSVKEAVKSIETYGLDVETVLEGVRRQWSLNKTLSDEVNTDIVRGAATISKAYSEVDFTELIQETHEMALSMEMTHQEALGLVNSLLKVGFPPDQLDIITEYGSQLTRAGYSASEIQAIFQAGVETGTWNIDVLLDGLKEGRIVLAEFGDGLDKATTELIQGTGISSKQLQQWGKDVAGGGEAGSKAMVEVAKAVEGIEDATKRNLVGVKLFGTLYEENGENITQTLINAQSKVIDLTANQNALNESTKKLDADPAIKLQKALSDMQAALAPSLTKIAEFVAKVAEWISENPKLAATITSVVTAVGILLGILMAIAPIFTALSAAAAAFGIGLAPLIGIVAGVVAAIALLIAAGVAIYKNWDTIKAKAIEIWGAIKVWFVETFETIKQGLISAWESISTFTSETWESIKETTLNVWTAIKDFFINIWNSITSGVMAILQPFIDGFMNIFNGMKDGITQIFEGLQQYFSGVWELIKNIFLGAILLITDLVTGDFEGLKNDSIAIFENIKNALADIWEGIKNIFFGAVSAIWGYVTASWENLKATTSAVMNAIKSTISSVWEGIKTAFWSAVENVKTTVVNGFENLKNSISEKMEAAKKKIEEIWGKVKSFFEGIDLLQIGKDIIQGLIDGFTSKAEAVWKKAQEIADKIKNTIRKALDINSPSRVMMELGEYTGEGLALGLKNSLGEIGKMSEKMATAAVPSISAPSLGQSVTNHTPISVTLHYNGSGNMSDAMTMVNLVERELTNRFGNGMRLAGGKA